MAVDIGSKPSGPMSKEGFGLVCCLIGILFGLFIGFILGYLDLQRFKREAVEVGVADFVADKTGNAHFIWKNIEQSDLKR